MKPLQLLLSFLLPGSCYCLAQQPDQLTLQQCYSLAEENYPMVKQHELISKTAEYSIDNIQKGHWPQLTVNGQASYQSDVTQIPVKIPGIHIPTLSKDQYKLYGEVTQVVYDGGAVRQQQLLQRTGADVQRRQLESELYQLRNRVNQFFFGVLLLDEQLKQNELLGDDIQIGLNKIQAAIANGTALKSNGDALRAELLKNKQQFIELKAGRKTYADMLALFTGKTINGATQFVKPRPQTASLQVNRPELKLFDAQSDNLDAQQKMAEIGLQPKMVLFLEGGAGRPALNFLSNNFQAYYIGGIRLTWSPSAYYTIKKERAIIDIGKKNVQLQKETFLFNTNLDLNRQNSEINKYSELLLGDDEIIELRNHVKTAALAQLENGVITSSDYLREVNAEDQARQNKMMHEIQLLAVDYTLQTTTGNVQ